MAYINAEKTADIRKNLKAAFPEVKFSVVNDDHIGVRVYILASKYDFTNLNTNQVSYGSVNHYHIEKNFKNRKTVQFLKKVISIANEGNYDDSDIQSDYHDVGWYLSLSIGRWDKPYIAL